MFKKQFLLAGLLLLSLVSSAQTAATQKRFHFIYELISNESKTTDFLFGFYPSTYTFEETKDIQGFTHIKGTVINQATQDLKME